MSAELSRDELMNYMKAAIDLETELATPSDFITKCCAEIQQRKPALHLSCT